MARRRRTTVADRRASRQASAKGAAGCLIMARRAGSAGCEVR
ncbi:hypothetical protein [Burkholderia oklahomensis]